MNIAAVIGSIGALVFASHLFEAIFRQTRVPDALPLIGIGLVLGPLTGVVTPEQFGAVGPVVTGMALVVILFEGGLGLDLHDLETAIPGTIKLTFLAFLATVAGVFLLATLFTGLTPLSAIILGAAVGGTSAAVTVPLLQQLKMQPANKTILILESTLNDVLCIAVVVSLLEVNEVIGLGPGRVAGQVVSSLVVAAFIGFAGALIWSAVLNRIRRLRHAVFTTPAFVFVLYGLAETLGYSGPITALAFGITIGNIAVFRLPIIRRHMGDEPVALNEVEKGFLAELVFLLKTFFFIYLGISISLRDLNSIIIGAGAVLLIFALRILVVRYSTSKTTPRTEASFMAVLAGKGFAAAVLASMPLQRGVAGGEVIRDVAYAVILFSIVGTSVMTILIERTRLAAVLARAFRGPVVTVQTPVPALGPALMNPPVVNTLPSAAVAPAAAAEREPPTSGDGATRDSAQTRDLVQRNRV